MGELRTKNEMPPWYYRTIAPGFYLIAALAALSQLFISFAHSATWNLFGSSLATQVAQHFHIYLPDGATAAPDKLDREAKPEAHPDNP